MSDHVSLQRPEQFIFICIVNSQAHMPLQLLSVSIPFKNYVLKRQDQLQTPMLRLGSFLFIKLLKFVFDRTFALTHQALGGFLSRGV
uniref:Uncharacterized protein n=1 Tax=Pararge aegeria TaxID=116150 RepID=S4P5H5_9NEOP